MSYILLHGVGPTHLEGLLLWHCPQWLDASASAALFPGKWYPDGRMETPPGRSAYDLFLNHFEAG